MTLPNRTRCHPRNPRHLTVAAAALLCGLLPVALTEATSRSRAHRWLRE
jgi:hypothetical protein